MSLLYNFMVPKYAQGETGKLAMISGCPPLLRLLGDGWPTLDTLLDANIDRRYGGGCPGPKARLDQDNGLIITS